MKLGFIKTNNTNLPRHAEEIRQGLYSNYSDPSFKGLGLLTKPVAKVINKEMVEAGDGLLRRTLQDFAKEAQNIGQNKMIEMVPGDLENLASGKINEMTIKVADPGVLNQLLSSAGYLFKGLWLDLGDSLCGGLRKIPGLKNSSLLQGIQNSKPIRNHKARVELNDSLHQVIGMSDAFSEGDAGQKFFNTFNKSLRNPQGNYDTKMERPLNRLATGLVSATFLGKDFYNISMYQKDDKKEAAKSEKKRFNQEVKRFLLNATISFLTLGALAKYTNKSKAAAIGVLAGTALVSETVSRIASGAPLLPLTPKQAKEYNQKHLQKEAEKESKKESNKQFFKGLQNSGMPETQNAADAKIQTNKETKEDNKINKKTAKRQRKPINKQLKMVLNVVGAAFAGGLALALGRKYSKAVNEACTEMAMNVSDFYNKMTQKTVWASQDDVNGFVNKIEEAGYKNLASRYRDVLTHEEFKAVRNGKPVYNLGKKEGWWKCVPSLIETLWKGVRMPYNIFAKALDVKPSEGVKSKIAKSVFSDDIKALSELYRFGTKKAKSSSEELPKVIDKTIRNIYNSGTKSKYSNASMAIGSRTIITLIASYFFVNDFRNKVLIDSNGEDVERAREVTNTRIGHKVANFFTNTFWMTLFNKAFETTYLGSLFGATAVAAATELCNETTIRKSIGVPIKRMESREEIQKFEEKNYNDKGFYGKWIRIVSKATGKKPLSEKAKEENKKVDEKKPKAKA